VSRALAAATHAPGAAFAGEPILRDNRLPAGTEGSVMQKVGAATLVVGAFIALVCACSSSAKDCTTLCRESQAGSCTTIKGDCATFCGAVDKVKGPSGCTSQYDAYQGCLNSTPKVCDATCNSQESAAVQCVSAYCAAKPSDTNCAVIVAAFQ
jgi:hypothetical protein